MAMRLACLGSGRSAQHRPFSTKKNENTASLCGDSHSLLCHSTSSYSTRICKKERKIPSCCICISFTRRDYDDATRPILTCLFDDSLLFDNDTSRFLRSARSLPRHLWSQDICNFRLSNNDFSLMQF